MGAEKTIAAKLLQEETVMDDSVFGPMEFPIQNIDFLKTLIKHNVRFLVIGGYAVRYHGHKRDVDDLDVLAPSDPENSPKICNVIMEEPSPRIITINPEQIRGKNIHHSLKTCWNCDIITEADRIDFDEVYTRKCVVKINQMGIAVIGKCDLIKMKLNSNREDESARQKDLSDARELKKIQSADPSHI